MQSGAWGCMENMGFQQCMAMHDDAFISRMDPGIMAKKKKEDRSLFLFGDDNVIRKWAQTIIEWGYPLHDWCMDLHGWCNSGAWVVHGWCMGGAWVVKFWCMGGEILVHG